MRKQEEKGRGREEGGGAPDPKMLPSTQICKQGRSQPAQPAQAPKYRTHRSKLFRLQRKCNFSKCLAVFCKEHFQTVENKMACFQARPDRGDVRTHTYARTHGRRINPFQAHSK